MALYDPTTGGTPELNQDVLLGTQMNGRWEIVQDTYKGNTPYGFQLLTPAQAKSYTLANASDLQSQINSYLNGGRHADDPQLLAMAKGVQDFNTQAAKYDSYTPPPQTGIQYVRDPITGNITTQSAIESQAANKAAVAAGTMVEIEPGKFVSKEAAAALPALNTANAANQAAGGVTAESKTPPNAAPGLVNPADPRLETMKQQLLAASETLKQTPIGNPVTPPAGGATYTPPATTNTASSTATTYTQSVAQNVEAQKAAVQAESDKRAADYQTQIDALNKQNEQLQTAEKDNLTSQGAAIKAEIDEQRAMIDANNKTFQAEMDAKNALINELNGLNTTLGSTLDQMNSTTGLKSIMDPRIAQATSNMTSRMTVINALMAAHTGNIGEAQSHMTAGLSAISNIATEQINYYKSVMDFYTKQQSDNNTKIAAGKNDQQKFLDAKLSILQDDLKNAQDMATTLSKAMLDPKTALLYNRAGVSLNDSPATAAQKVAMQSAADDKAWGTPYKMGTDYVQANKNTGEVRMVQNNPATGNGGSVVDTRTAVEGQDLADAKAHWADSTWRTAHPNITWADMKQTFLTTHPSSSAAWDSYYPQEPQSPVTASAKPWWQFW